MGVWRFQKKLTLFCFLLPRACKHGTHRQWPSLQWWFHQLYIAYYNLAYCPLTLGCQLELSLLPSLWKVFWLDSRLKGLRVISHICVLSCPRKPNTLHTAIKPTKVFNHVNTPLSDMNVVSAQPTDEKICFARRKNAHLPTSNHTSCSTEHTQ